MQRVLHVLFLISIFLLIIRPQEFVPGWADSSIMQVVSILALIVWALCPQTHEGIAPLKWAFALVFCACISSGLNGWWGGGASVVKLLLPAIACFLLASSSTQEINDFRRFCRVIVFCCLVLVYHGWQQATYGVGFTGTEPVDGTRIRYIGILNDPNDLGLLFCIGFVLTGYLMATGSGIWSRTLALFAGGAIAYGVYLTESRGTMLACLAALACVGVRRYGVGRCLALASIALPILWGVTRLSTISTGEESAEGRIDAWYEGFQMLKEHPLFGVGMGGFVDHNDLTAHNSLVLAMAELGVIGYTFWFLFFVQSATMVAYAARLKSLASRSPNLDAARTVVVAGISVIVAALFLSRSYNPIMFLLAGAATARYAAGLRDAAEPLSKGSWPIQRTIVWAWVSIPIMYVVTIILLRL